mgnify:CR=1 FL=1
MTKKLTQIQKKYLAGRIDDIRDSFNSQVDRIHYNSHEVETRITATVFDQLYKDGTFKVKTDIATIIGSYLKNDDREYDHVSFYGDRPTLKLGLNDILTNIDDWMKTRRREKIEAEDRLKSMKDNVRMMARNLQDIAILEGRDITEELDRFQESCNKTLLDYKKGTK